MIIGNVSCITLWNTSKSFFFKLRVSIMIHWFGHFLFERLVVTTSIANVRVHVQMVRLVLFRVDWRHDQTSVYYHPSWSSSLAIEGGQRMARWWVAAERRRRACHHGGRIVDRRNIGTTSRITRSCRFCQYCFVLFLDYATHSSFGCTP